jgi:hypothetical protein
LHIVSESTCGEQGGVESWILDHYCDVENNNVECDYDGGDCCGALNTQYCGDNCACLDPDDDNTGMYTV